MRVLVVGRNAKVLAKATAAGAFVSNLKIETAASKAAALALLERGYDLIVACEVLSDGLGLEVLNHIAVNTPDTLRIFAARPSTLERLKGELGLFGLFRTLSYPINFRKLWAALNLARSCLGETEPPAARVQHVVLEGEWETIPPTRSEDVTPVQTSPSGQVVPQGMGGAAASANVASRPAAPLPQQSRQAASAHAASSSQPMAAEVGRPVPLYSAAPAKLAPTSKPAPAPAAANSAPAHPPAPQQAVRATARPQSTHGRAAPPQQAAATAPRAKAAGHRPKTRIPESEAFKRARAKRNAERLEANSFINAVDLGLATKPGVRDGSSKRRREPGMTTESLAQLARLATTRRPISIYPRDALPRKRRAALFVGSGVFAAGTAAVLSFIMLHANNSMGRSSLPIPSIDRPIPDKVFPWQPPTQPQPTPAAAFVRSATPTPAAADLDVQAEAASEPFEVEPGHPGPPPPNPPPGPSEPPSAESLPQPQWVDE